MDNKVTNDQPSLHFSYTYNTKSVWIQGEGERESRVE